MSVKGDKADQHLLEAVGFALNHKPCVVACKTVKALEAADKTLRANGHTVRLARVQNPHTWITDSINDFEGGNVDYLVISTALLYVRPLQFRRVGASLACSDALVQSRIVAFQLLLGNEPLEADRVFAKQYTKGRNNAPDESRPVPC